MGADLLGSPALPTALFAGPALQEDVCPRCGAYQTRFSRARPRVTSTGALVTYCLGCDSEIEETGVFFHD